MRDAKYLTNTRLIQRKQSQEHHTSGPTISLNCRKDSQGLSAFEVYGDNDTIPEVKPRKRPTTAPRARPNDMSLGSDQHIHVAVNSQSGKKSQRRIKTYLR